MQQQPRRASCIVLLRKGKHQKELEVLMAQRSKNLRSFGGAFVFPGGVVEQCDGPEGSPEQSKRCGLRELFEEAGVLLTKSARGNRTKPVEFSSPAERRSWQKKVHDHPLEFEKLVKEKNVILATSALFHWITFITPIMEPRRFHTDFFVVDSRYEEEGLELDGGETVSLTWISPTAALAKNEKEEMPFLPPQYFVLSTIMRSGETPAQIIESVVKRKPLETFLPILPHPISMEGKELTLTYPGDEEHCDFPGKKGWRHRIKVQTPIGMNGGYRFETTLKDFALTQGEWEKVQKSSAL